MLSDIIYKIVGGPLHDECARSMTQEQYKEDFAMNKLVAEYLSEKEVAEHAEELKKKNELLLNLGLYEKIYTKDTVSSAEFPYGDWDEEAGAYRYYKKVPVEVTDEEYAKILHYQREKPETGSTNGVAFVFRVMAWITFIVGFIAGLVLGAQERIVLDYYSVNTSTEFSFATAFACWGVFFVSGMFLLGFSEIIRLLNDMNDKQAK